MTRILKYVVSMRERSARIIVIHTLRCQKFSKSQPLASSFDEKNTLERNENTHTRTQVRGPHYASDRKKINSLSSMFEVAAVDLFKCKRKVDNISSFVTLPLPREEKAREALRQSRLDQKRTPWYVISFQSCTRRSLELRTQVQD